MTNFTIQFQDRIGVIRPMHGVNNGPLCSSEMTDLSRYFAEAGIPLIRFHDTDYPNPRQIDLPKIFPDFSADPEDPASYDFRHSDVYMRAAYAAGAKVLYRLGTSIEHMRNKVDIYPPQDYDKWARICIGVIRHYTQGWADGYEYDVPYWEIWNEPDNAQDNPNMWVGEPATYYRFYEIASKAIKAEFPQCKIGGYAGCSIGNAQFPRTTDFREGFLQYVRDSKSPFDFFSWHGYSYKPDQIAKDAVLARQRLDAYGFTETEILCDEWNYIDPAPDFWTRFLAVGNESLQEEVFEKQKRGFGASFVASAFIHMQNSPLTASNYYDGQPSSTWCGLFNLYGVPQPTFYTFKAYNTLYRLQSQVKVQGADENTQCLAAANGETMGVLLSNHSSDSSLCALHMDPLTDSPTEARFYLLNDSSPLELNKIEYYSGGRVTQYVSLPPYSVMLITMQKAEL